MTMKRKGTQQGVTIIEFTVVSAATLLLIFAILEAGYFVFSMQSLNDLTRRTARIAAVCQVDQLDKVKSLALSEKAPLGITSANLQVTFLDREGEEVDDPLADHSSIYYVRAGIINYQFGFTGILSFLGNNGLLTIPPFQTILPAESLGIERPDAAGDPQYADCK
ncbi:pilus assembly protein [Vibrio fluvialis]|uniref:TadE family protein n=1 Tax=Vibrio fluvialis TaxID=676 RepID=UPI000C2292A9|nr:TadE family protein [Vibrio fluvialis]MBY7824604.1 pilus assembly protein [Vibrio fluvialis]MBY7883829.1 pilus assembly protein [Vibrio fluvialis]MBY7927059.1 pilus assembly protein [Vibrio fluvialis]MBY8007504.1 pilus assembly protein [Vibrio fluvialis]MBY8071234.1 pilus assembly protein [Vibrio fluvialis]